MNSKNDASQKLQARKFHGLLNRFNMDLEQKKSYAIFSLQHDKLNTYKYLH